MMENIDHNLDGSNYEFFIRKAFGCQRGATRYPYADSHEWTSLVIRAQWASKSGSTSSERKEYDKYFKQMLLNFEKTIDYVLKTYDSKEKYHELVEQFKNLK